MIGYFCYTSLPARFRILGPMAEIPESAKLFVSGLIERARKLKKTIAFPEGGDPRVLDAAARLAHDGVVRPLLRRFVPEPTPACPDRSSSSTAS
jgi:hypothetical protein